MPYHSIIYYGRFCVIIPHKEEDTFTALASEFGLHANTVLQVRGNPSSSIKRSLMTFSFHQKGITYSELTIEISRHQYTQDYINLTKDFFI